MSARHKWPSYGQWATEVARPDGVACLKCGLRERWAFPQDLRRAIEFSIDDGKTWERTSETPPCAGGG